MSSSREFIEWDTIWASCAVRPYDSCVTLLKEFRQHLVLGLQIKCCLNRPNMKLTF